MRQIRKQSVARDADGEAQFDSIDEAFELLGMDLPENLRRSVPSLSNVASFLVENDAFGLGMDEDAFTRILEDERD